MTIVAASICLAATTYTKAQELNVEGTLSGTTTDSRCLYLSPVEYHNAKYSIFKFSLTLKSSWYPSS